MLADELDYVIGVDAHRDEHALAVVGAPVGALVAGTEIGANGGGYKAALRFAEHYAAGRRAWAIEGTGGYGAGLARFLAERGEVVCAVSRIPRAGRRLQGKTTRSTRPGRPGPHSPTKRSRSRARASGVRRCGSCWSRDEVPSTSALKP